MNKAVLILALTALPLALSAQWPDYPTTGIPKGPDGKPKLDAPTPRTADGHPDLSGIWENRRGNIGRAPGGGRGAAPPPEGAPPPPPPPAPASDGPPAAT